MQPKSQVGRIGEDIAVNYLLKHKFKILARNVFVKNGEIDIIAQKDSAINFFEVRSTTRKFNDFNSILELISRFKLYKLARTVRSYIFKNPVIYEHEIKILFIFIGRASALIFEIPLSKLKGCLD